MKVVTGVVAVGDVSVCRNSPLKCRALFLATYTELWLEKCQIVGVDNEVKDEPLTKLFKMYR